MKIHTFNLSYGRITVIALLAVIFCGLFLRIAKTGSNPPSMNWDEVSIGYNAYSILKTGRDEFGESFPLYFRSLDDYKMPVYIYLTVLSESVFGLTDLAVRLPSIVFGMLSVFVMYQLGLLLFKRKSVGVLSAFVFAILPWNIMFSRMASEANVATSIVLLAVWSFVLGVRGRPKLLSASVVLLGLASYTYLSFRVLAPLTGLVLIAVFWKYLVRDKRVLLYTVLPALLIAVFLTKDILSPQTRIRFSGTNFLSHENELLEFNKNQIELDGLLGIDEPRRLLHDSMVLPYARIIARSYFSHFSPDFLFFGEGHKQESSIFTGLLYLWMVPFLLYGSYRLMKSDAVSRNLILALLLIAPIPASLTWDVPHAIRTLSMVIPLSYLTALGLSGLFDWTMVARRRYAFGLVTLGISAVIGFSVYVFWHEYFIHMPVERSQHWQYGMKDLTEYLERVKSSYDAVIVSTRLEWPYIFLLYYSKYDPQRYLAEGGTKSGGWSSQENAYDRYVFRRIDNATDFNHGKLLLVGKPDDFWAKNGYIRVFFYKDGTPAVTVFETNGR